MVTIAADAPPVAKFKFTITGKQVNFVDQSTGSPTDWLWNFGDGASSTLQNPAHVYAAAGTYNVMLTVTNAGGSNGAGDTVVIAPGAAPKAAFEATVSGHQVNFVDRSTGNPTSWLWDFGDGGKSTSQNPVHTYGAAGTYTVTLTAANADGSNSASQVVTIAAGTPPKAAFEFIVNGAQVNFVDRSTGNPTSWKWTFGDPKDTNPSFEQNPVHTYKNAGSYTVTLTVFNGSGSDSTSQVVTTFTSSP